MKRYAILLACIIAVLAVGFAGSLVTSPNLDSWYQFLDKPPLNPPNGVFGPVWTTLYVLIGISLWKIITTTTRKSKTFVYSLFGIQLGLNFLWSLVFFGFQSPAWALVVILLLLVAIYWYIDEAREFSAATLAVRTVRIMDDLCDLPHDRHRAGQLEYLPNIL